LASPIIISSTLISWWHVNVNQHAGDFARGGGHRALRHAEIETVSGDEVVDQVELLTPYPVQLDHNPILDLQAGRGVERAVEGYQADFRPRFDEGLAVDGSLRKFFRTLGSHILSLVLA
jgi:hypothetical protein